MVDVGSGDIDSLEELGHKIKVVSGGVEKLLTPVNLTPGTLVSGSTIEEAETYLLYPENQFF